MVGPVVIAGTLVLMYVLGGKFLQYITFGITLGLLFTCSAAHAQRFKREREALERRRADTRPRAARERGPLN